MASTSKLNQVQISSSNSTVITASSSATATADAGSYSIKVDTLATPKKMVAAFSDNYIAPSGLLMTLDVPSMVNNPPKIDISGKSPKQIITAINSWVRSYAPTSKFSATLVDTRISTLEEPRSLRIILQGAPGTADTFDVKVGTTADPNSFTEALFPLSGSRAATKAQFAVNGVSVERASNTVTDVISGLTLELNATSDVAVTISAKPDPTAVLANIQNFVDSYNAVTDFIKKATGPAVAGDEVAGSLKNDAVARGVLSQLRSKIQSQFSEVDKNISITHFSALGIEFDRNGVLQFKYPEKFKDAFANKTSDVVTALSNNTRNLDPETLRPSGLAGDVARLATSMISSSTSRVPMMIKGYEQVLARVDKKQAVLDAYIDRLTQQYDRQFSALNSVLASFKSTQSQLEKSLNLKNDN